MVEAEKSTSSPTIATDPTRKRGLSRIWRGVIVISALWLIGTTALFYKAYNAYIGMDEPVPMTHEAWNAAQQTAADAAEQSCISQRTRVTDALIRAEISSGTDDAKAEADKERMYASNRSECAGGNSYINPLGYFAMVHDVMTPYIDAERAFYLDVKVTLGGLAAILVAPLLIGFSRIIFCWVRAGH